MKQRPQNWAYTHLGLENRNRLYKFNQWDNKEARKRPMCNQRNSNKAGTADHQEKEFGGF